MNQKKIDALELIKMLIAIPNERSEIIPDFKLETPYSWIKAVSHVADKSLS